jgi:hypothetical protein
LILLCFVGSGAEERTGTSGQTNDVGAIVGGVIGGLAAIVVFSVAGICFYRRRKNKESKFLCFEYINSIYMYK